MDNDKIIDSARRFLKIVKDKGVVKIRFRKKTTGELRDMICTLDFNRIPKDVRPKSFDFEKTLRLLDVNKILHVYDLERQSWRSVPFDRVMFLDDGQIKYNIKIR